MGLLRHKNSLLLICLMLTYSVAIASMKQNRLSPCPEKPNCVNSMSSSAGHAIAAIQYSVDIVHARRVLLKVLGEQSRTEIMVSEKNYIHSTFTSLILRFVDDVEFQFDASEKVIHVRSASRTGHSDFGVNRKRVEKLRLLFNQAIQNDVSPASVTRGKSE